MANEQTSVPLYAAAEVLTAANMNISAGTGVPVFATTVTRDAAFGGAGEKVLAEGQLCYLSASNIVQYYDGAAWATVGPATAGALVYLTGASFSAASTVSMATGVFTSTYQNYKVLFNATGSGVLNVNLRFNYSGTPATTNYYGGSYGAVSAYSGVNEVSNGASLYLTGVHTAAYNAMGADITVFDPSAAGKFGSFSGTSQGSYVAGPQFGGYLVGGQRQTAGAVDGLTFITTAGTITGSYRVYGVANS
jgi:hypothetical protein